MGRGALLGVCVVIAGALLFAVLQIDFDLNDARVQQGAIAAIVVITGWLVTFVFREARAIFERSELSRDLQTALSAEIFDYSEALRVDNPKEWKKRMQEEVLTGGDSGDRSFFPFFARISEPVVFDSLSDRVLLLPPSTIDSVIQFYSTLSDLRLFIEDIRQEDFRRLSAARRLTAYKDLVDLQNTVVDIADQALKQLELSLNGIPDWMVGPNGVH